MPGHVKSAAEDVSGDGSVVVGTSCETFSNLTTCRAVRWTGTAAVALPFDDEEEDDATEAHTISADGTLIGGFLYGNKMSGLVQWRANDAPEQIGGRFLWAWPHAMSADGSVVAASNRVPQRTDPLAPQADDLFRVQGETVTELPLPDGLARGGVLGISGDGRILVGSAYDAGYSRPLMWGPEGLEELSLPDSAVSGMAVAASDDGSVIIGMYEFETGGDRIAIWRDGVFSDVIDELNAQGMNVPRGQLWPRAVSADGKVIVGRAAVGGMDSFRLELGGLVVNEDGDESDADPGDGECDINPNADGPQCTLRAALEEANASPGPDAITFRLEGDGPHLIQPQSPLPTITGPVHLDASTQPGTTTVPLVRVDGASAGEGASGLTIRADNVTVRGLIITGFAGHGIHVASGSGSVLEGLIVGSDASGTAGLGNGGDGIHISGAADLRVGSEQVEEGSASLMKSVTLAGNALSGLYARDASNAGRLRAGKTTAAAAPTVAGLRFVNVIVGMVDAASGAVARTNGQSGISLEGVADVYLDAIRVSDAAADAIRIVASRAIQIRRAQMGLRRALPTSTGHIGGIHGSILRIIESVDVTIGSDNPQDAPVQGGGASGWFVDVERSENVQVRNVLAGISDNIENLSASAREMLRNLTGGIRIADSPNVTVGAVGVPSVFANNGGNDEQPQAGFLAIGAATRALRALNLHIGTTPSGLSGIGNLGDGFVLADGVREALLGGDSEEEQIVSAGNGGFGFHFRKLFAAAGLPLNEKLGTVVTANRLVSDLVKAAGQVIPLSNQSTGIRLDEVEAVRLTQLSIGPALKNGMEVIRSIGVEVESAAVGMYWNRLVQELDDIQGPEGDGIVIEESSDVAIGRRLYEEYVTTGYLVHVVGAGGRALHAHKSARLKLANWASGLSLEGSEESDAIFDALGSELEAMVVEESEDVAIENAAFMSNGSSASSGGGGLLVTMSKRIQVLRSIFGELTRELEARRQNHHAALKALQSQDVRVKLSRIVGHARGVVADGSSVRLEGNLIKLQGLSAGDGVAVQAIGQSLVQAARNLVTDNDGPGFWFMDGATGLLRHNDVEGNGQGVVVEAGGNKTGRRNAAVLAPDNWWGDASGPGGVGPGSGDAITDGVEASTWRSGPLGVIVEPEARVVTGWAVTDVTIPVAFESPLFSEDVLDVTITDERGWVTSETAFEVAVSAASGARRVIDVTLFQAGVNTVTIRAVSQSNPALSAEAVVTIGSPRHFVSMDDGALAGSTLLAAEAEEVFVVGGEIVINPGGANEETATVAGFGSILLTEPLRFDHAAGEPIAPSNRFAVEAEEGPAPASPASTDLLVYPNPAAGMATLRLDLPQSGTARVELFDVVGRRVRLVQEGVLPAGRHEWRLDLRELPPGVYLARVNAADRRTSRTLVVAR